jgi:DNA invertase Pin-like site-specific DNA recombinase
VEVESGKKNQRPKLLAAIAAARAVGGVSLIAKLDRLSRNAGFILALRDSGVQLACCDMPDANTLTVGLFAIIAQHERETISQRTKDALKAKKARGAQLGTSQVYLPPRRTAATRLAASSMGALAGGFAFGSSYHLVLRGQVNGEGVEVMHFLQGRKRLHIC